MHQLENHKNTKSSLLHSGFDNSPQNLLFIQTRQVFWHQNYESDPSAAVIVVDVDVNVVIVDIVVTLVVGVVVNELQGSLGPIFVDLCENNFNDF